MTQSITARMALASLFFSVHCAHAAGAAAAPHPDQPASGVVPIPGVVNAPAPTPAPAPPVAPARPITEVCAVAASDPSLSGGKYDRWILFDVSGAVCYLPNPLKQKDTLHFAVVVAPHQVAPASVTVSATACTTPTSVPVVVGAAPNSVVPQNDDKRTNAVLVTSPNAFACESDSPVLSVTVTQPDGTPSTKTTPLTLYSRTTATVNVGVLYTRLIDHDYALLTTGGQTVITDKSPQTRGPKYVATLVVQAFPRYLENMSFHGPVYPGRDMLHDNEFADRVGLAVSFGLQDPAKRFGLGLSYEIANGINLVGIHEWVNRSTLNGVKVGDAFTGAATDIPTRNEWAKGWAIGLTFDATYLTNIFTKK